MNSKQVIALMVKWSELATAGKWQEAEAIEQEIFRIWDAELAVQFPDTPDNLKWATQDPA